MNAGQRRVGPAPVRSWNGLRDPADFQEAHPPRLRGGDVVDDQGGAAVAADRRVIVLTKQAARLRHR